MIPTLETPRLRLRPFRNDDLDVVASWMSDEDTVRYIGGKTLDRADAWRHIAMLCGHWMLRGYGFWAVEDKRSGALVGRAGLWNPEGWPGVEVAWLTGKDHRGQGIALEAARAAVAWGFARLDLPRIVSVIHVKNAASIRVAEKLGERRIEEREIRGFPCALYALDRPAP